MQENISDTAKVIKFVLSLCSVLMERTGAAFACNGGTANAVNVTKIPTLLGAFFMGYSFACKTLRKNASTRFLLGGLKIEAQNKRGTLVPLKVVN